VSIKIILFDLDGTLLPMDQEFFVKKYFSSIANNLSQYGYEPKKLIDTIGLGTMAMINNEGIKTNEQVFWELFCKVYGADARKDEEKFKEFYDSKFIDVKETCGFNPLSKVVIEILKEKGFRIVLATNPIFPFIATKNRIEWAGLKVEDFELITVYENSSFCKPNLNYYKEILGRLNARPEDCLMVGNDVGEDMIAKNLGIEVFLLTDCLINKKEANINEYQHGSFNELIEYIENI